MPLWRRRPSLMTAVMYGSCSSCDNPSRFAEVIVAPWSSVLNFRIVCGLLMRWKIMSERTFAGVSLAAIRSMAPSSVNLSRFFSRAGRSGLERSDSNIALRFLFCLASFILGLRILFICEEIRWQILKFSKEVLQQRE